LASVDAGTVDAEDVDGFGVDDEVDEDDVGLADGSDDLVGGRFGDCGGGFETRLEAEYTCGTFCREIKLLQMALAEASGHL